MRDRLFIEQMVDRDTLSHQATGRGFEGIVFIIVNDGCYRKALSFQHAQRQRCGFVDLLDNY